MAAPQVPSSSANAPAPSPWHSSLPAPRAKPDSISVHDLHEAMQRPRRDDGEAAKKQEYLVVDVRRADIEGDTAYMIPGAINLPAQTFHQTLPALLPLLSRSRYVVFHCNASTGRGPRCAAWYQDALNERRGSAEEEEEGESSKALVLTGGIKAWLKEYPEEVVKI